MKVTQRIILGLALGLGTGIATNGALKEINQVYSKNIDPQENKFDKKEPLIKELAGRSEFDLKEKFVELKHLSNKELALLFVRVHYDWTYFPFERDRHFDIAFEKLELNRKNEIRKHLQALDNEIKTAIIKHGDTNPVKTITDSMSNDKNLILMVGDNHINNKDDELFLNIVLSMHAAKQLSAIGLELPYTLDKEVNDWLKGKSNVDIFSMLEKEIGSTIILGNSYNDLLKSLRKLITKNPKINVICFDTPKKERVGKCNEREQFMFNSIIDKFLTKVTKGKIAIYVGSEHIKKLTIEDKKYSKRFANLLSEHLKSSSKSMISVFSDYRLTPYRQVWQDEPLNEHGIWTNRLPLDFYSRDGYPIKELYDYLVMLK